MLDQGKGCVEVWCYYFIQDNEGKSPWKMAVKHRCGGSEGAGHGLTWGKSFPGRRNTKCNSPGREIYLTCFWMSRSPVMLWDWHILFGLALIERVLCCCLCFSHSLWSSAFHRWRTQESNVCSAPSVLAIPEIRSETFWSMMRDRELEYTSCWDDSIHAECQSTSGYQL